MIAEEAARLKPEDRGAASADSEPDESKIGEMIRETLADSGVAEKPGINSGGNLSEEIKISPEEQSAYEFKLKERASAEAAKTGASWHDGNQAEFEAGLAEIDSDDGRKPTIEVEEVAMREVEDRRELVGQSRIYVSQKEALNRGEVSLEEATDSVLRRMAQSIVGMDADPKHLEDMIIQSRGMMRMHLRENGPSRMTDEQALARVRNFMTKLWDGKRGDVPSKAEVSAETAGRIAVSIGELRRLPENNRGPQVKAMLESLARELMGADAEDKKVEALAQSYEGLVRSFLKIDQMSGEEVANQLTRQMRSKADRFSGRKAA